MLRDDPCDVGGNENRAAARRDKVSGQVVEAELQHAIRIADRHDDFGENEQSDDVDGGHEGARVERHQQLVGKEQKREHGREHQEHQGPNVFRDLRCSFLFRQIAAREGNQVLGARRREDRSKPGGHRIGGGEEAGGLNPELPQDGPAYQRISERYGEADGVERHRKPDDGRVRPQEIEQ